MNMTSTRLELQKAIVARLLEPEMDIVDENGAKLPNPISLHNVPVFSRLAKDIESDIDDNLKGIGLNVFVHPAVGKGAKQYAHSIVFKGATFDVTVSEDPTTNELPVNVWDVCEAVCLMLGNWTPPLDKARIVTLADNPETDSSQGNLRQFTETFNLMFLL